MPKVTRSRRSKRGMTRLASVIRAFRAAPAFTLLASLALAACPKPTDGDPQIPIAPNLDMSVLLSANGVAVLLLGLFPQPLMALCFLSIKSL